MSDGELTLFVPPSSRRRDVNIPVVCGGRGRNATDDRANEDGGGEQEQEKEKSHRTNASGLQYESNPRCTLARSQAIPPDTKWGNGRITPHRRQQPWPTYAAGGYSHRPNPDRGIGRGITTRREIRHKEGDHDDASPLRPALGLTVTAPGPPHHRCRHPRQHDYHHHRRDRRDCVVPCCCLHHRAARARPAPARTSTDWGRRAARGGEGADEGMRNSGGDINEPLSVTRQHSGSRHSTHRHMLASLVRPAYTTHQTDTPGEHGNNHHSYAANSSEDDARDSVDSVRDDCFDASCIIGYPSAPRTSASGSADDVRYHGLCGLLDLRGGGGLRGKPRSSRDDGRGVAAWLDAEESEDERRVERLTLKCGACGTHPPSTDWGWCFCRQRQCGECIARPLCPLCSAPRPPAE